MIKRTWYITCLLIFIFLSCSINIKTVKDNTLNETIITILSNPRFPQEIKENILKETAESQNFINELQIIMMQDPYLYLLVDKNHPLDKDYNPKDLVTLKKGSYSVNREAMELRSAAAASLEEMADAAKNDNITLLVISAYRSYSSQNTIYTNYVRTIGQIAADRASAKPGHSQHQLGFTADFGLLNNRFAQTAEGIWLYNNASRFGWSLSYPDGYEEITGYQWESWHYRYVGKELAEFINKYFNGIQQYALEFIHNMHNITN